MEQSKAMECESRKASSDVLEPRNTYKLKTKSKVVPFNTMSVYVGVQVQLHTFLTKVSDQLHAVLVLPPQSKLPVPIE